MPERFAVLAKPANILGVSDSLTKRADVHGARLFQMPASIAPATLHLPAHQDGVTILLAVGAGDLLRRLFFDFGTVFAQNTLRCGMSPVPALVAKGCLTLALGVTLSFATIAPLPHVASNLRGLLAALRAKLLRHFRTKNKSLLARNFV